MEVREAGPQKCRGSKCDCSLCLLPPFFPLGIVFFSSFFLETKFFHFSLRWIEDPMNTNSKFQAFTSTPQKDSQTLYSLNYTYPWGAACWSSLRLCPWTNQLWPKVESCYLNMLAHKNMRKKEVGGTSSQKPGYCQLCIRGVNLCQLDWHFSKTHYPPPHFFFSPVAHLPLSSLLFLLSLLSFKIFYSSSSFTFSSFLSLAKYFLLPWITWSFLSTLPKKIKFLSLSLFRITLTDSKFWGKKKKEYQEQNVFDNTSCPPDLFSLDLHLIYTLLCVHLSLVRRKVLWEQPGPNLHFCLSPGDALIHNYSVSYTNLQ